MTDPSGWKLFADGDILPANEIRGYLQQGVMVFDDAAARDSTLVGALREGMIAYVKDTDTVSYYDGAAWNVITGQIAFASEAARDAAIPNPVDGRYAFTTDLDRLWLRASGAWTLLSAPGTANFSNAASGTYSSAGVDFKWLQFTTDGTLTITRAGQVDVLVVGGGGAGGVDQFGGSAGGGGGGGAGGLIEQTIYLAAGAYPVVIGAGATASSNPASALRFGRASSLANLAAVGGGSGGIVGGAQATGGYGGSGGGGTDTLNGGPALSGQGNAGANAPVAGQRGGGGGAGGAGAVDTAGAGKSSSITGSAVTYAVGGATTGGAAGTTNRGNGGANPLGNGGSGIVIVRVRTN